jgi:hypothetical protein
LDDLYFGKARRKRKHHEPLAEKFLFKNTPAYSFGVRNHMEGRNKKINDITPSPLQYQKMSTNKRNYSGTKFGTAQRARVFSPQDLDIPGLR